jgi:Tfp pilus assembly protein PilF
LKKNLNRILAMNPNYHYATNTLGDIDHAVPGIAGGSDSRAEEAYLGVLKKDPHFTSSMLRMARLKRDNGDDEEARQWAQKVVDEQKPTLPNDHRKFDLKEAKTILAELSK